MASKPLTPVQLIDQATADAEGGSVILDLSSYGAPIRLCLEPRLAGPLSTALRMAAELAVDQRDNSCEIIQFPRRA